MKKKSSPESTRLAVALKNEKQALEQQAATAEILHAISRSPGDAGPVFETILDKAHRLCGAAYTVLYSYDGTAVNVLGSRGMTVKGMRVLRSNYPQTPKRDKLIGRAVLEAKLFHTDDINSDPRFPSATKALPRRTVIVVPLVRGKKVLGAISCGRVETRAFSKDEIRLLKTFADQAVIAIENVRLFNETKESLEQQTATAEILKVIASSPTEVQPVFDVIVERAVRLCGARFGRVYRYDGSMIQMVASHGLSAKGLGKVQRVFPRPAADDTIVGRVIVTKQPYFMQDVERDKTVPELSRQMIKALNTRRQLTIPMLRAGQPIGAITLGWDKPGTFDEQQVALLRTFADQAVIAIENVRLFNETKEALERQTSMSQILGVISSSPTNLQPVFDAILENATRLCEANLGILGLYDGKYYQVASQRGANPAYAEYLADQGPYEPAPAMAVARMIAERRPIHVHDMKESPQYREGNPNAVRMVEVGGARTFVVVPLMKEGRVVGGIGIYRPEVRPFTETQIGLLRAYADQAVIAIENVRLFNETKDALERQTATGEILQVISRSPTDVQPVFNAILGSATRLCDAHFGLLGLYQGEQYRYVAHRGSNDEFGQWVINEGLFKPRPSGGIGRMTAERRPVLIPNLKESVPYREGNPITVALADIGGVRTYLSVPMFKDGVVIGGITIYRAEVREFTQKQIDLLSIFASQAVIAIENVRLFNETKEALEQQTAISEVLRVISSSPADVKPVLDAVAERASKICDAGDAQIFLREGDDLKHVARFGPIPIGIELGDTRRLSRGWVAGRAVLEGKALHIEDLLAVPRAEFPVSHELRDRAGHRTLLSVPLMRERRALGAISLRRMEVRPFTEKQIALLNTFADQAAIAIENVRLFNETKEALEQQKASADVLSVISSSIADTKPVFDRILTSCERLFAGRLVGINLLGDDGLIRVGAYHGPGREEFERVFPLPLSREAGTGLAILDRRVLHYPDVANGPGVPPGVRQGCAVTGIKACIFAPMLWEGRGVGAIFVGRDHVGEFSEKESALLKTFADQAAIAIQNSRLFREIQEKSAQLEVASQHKSQFLASMSHELRTPLNALLGFNEMLLGDIYGEVPGDMRPPLAQMQSSGKHLLRLINNVLDLAKIEAGRMELALAEYSVHDTVESVRSTLLPLAADKGLDFRAAVPPDIPLAYGDPGRIMQCLMNLAGNSLKFTKAGTVEISVAMSDGLLRYRVADTGIGIPPDKIEGLFTEFKQTDATVASEYGGTGLGLSISRKFVEMHGGRIWAESEPGKGSVFTFEVPLRARAT